MKLPALVTSDLHLTSDPAHEYRWGLFPWLAAQVRAERVRTLLVLGDLTDAKDNHGAELVNRVVGEVKKLADLGMLEIVVLAGNHDWLRAGHEFFRFLSVLPGVRFVTRPAEDADTSGPLAYFLPYSKSPAREWKGMDFGHYDYLFMHQTVGGARSSNGQLMEGEDLPELNAAKVYSGDIHVPQVVGGVEYVGSPYHVHMGDAFTPRCVLLERGGRARDLHFETISRRTVEVASLAELDALGIRPDDHVKLRLRLGEAEKHDWSALRRRAQDKLAAMGARVHGVELVVAPTTACVRLGHARAAASPAQALENFVADNELGGEALDAALDILEGSA